MHVYMRMHMHTHCAEILRGLNVIIEKIIQEYRKTLWHIIDTAKY